MKTLDISKCEGTECSKRDDCWRYVKEPLVRYQSYIVMCVAIPKVEDCKYFYPIPSEEV